MSQRGDILTNLAVIALVGQIPGFTQLGGLGYKPLDDLHLEKLKVSIRKTVSEPAKKAIWKPNEQGQMWD